MNPIVWTFAGIKSALVTKLKEYEEWSVEILTTGVYSVLLDIVSFIVEKIAYMAEFWFVETTTNAILTSSVVNQARFLGYEPPRKSGCSGILTLGSDSTFTALSNTYTGLPIAIAKWQQFQDNGGNNFVYATEDKTFSTGSVQRNRYLDASGTAVDVTQGVVGLPVSGHPFIPGEEIKISGTQNYNGLFIVQATTTATRVHILSKYVPETFSGSEILSAGYLFFPVKEGVINEFVYTGNGVQNESIPIYNANIDQDSIEVKHVDVNGNVIQEISIVADLFFVNDTSVYTCQIENFDDFTGITILFGDGITSKQLVATDRIQIRYAVTKGAQGNIESRAIITKPSIGFTDSSGNPLSTIYVTNQDQILGGTDFLTSTQIKKTSKVLYNSGNQLNNRESWISAIEEASFVSRGMMWTELDLHDGTLPIAATPDQNVHYVTAIKTDGRGLTVSEETQISLTLLLPRKDPVDIISWQPLKKVLIKFIIDGVIRNQYSVPASKQIISDALTVSYDVLSLEFGQEIYQSNYTKVIDSTAPIIRHSTNIYYADEDIPRQAVLLEAQVRKPAGDEPDATKQILFVQDQVEIWIRRKIDFEWKNPLKIAHANGFNVDPDNTFNVSGNVVYTESEVSYQVFDIMSDVVPSFDLAATTTNSSNVITMVDTTDIQVGMYVTGINVVVGSKVTDITVNTQIIIDTPTDTSGAAAGTLTFCWFEDPGASFGTRDPNDDEADGYILYLLYQTEDGNGNRVGDLRTSNFDQIFDYSSELSEFNLTYS